MEKTKESSRVAPGDCSAPASLARRWRPPSDQGHQVGHEVRSRAALERSAGREQGGGIRCWLATIAECGKPQATPPCPLPLHGMPMVEPLNHTHFPAGRRHTSSRTVTRRQREVEWCTPDSPQRTFCPSPPPSSLPSASPIWLKACWMLCRQSAGSGFRMASATPDQGCREGGGGEQSNG